MEQAFISTDCDRQFQWSSCILKQTKSQFPYTVAGISSFVAVNTFELEESP